MSYIVTTIGPASFDRDILAKFKDMRVKIARLNFSHGTSDWHIEAGNMCREFGFKLMADLAGPKILLGSLRSDQEVKKGQKIFLEFSDERKRYPYQDLNSGKSTTVFPCQFEIAKYVEKNKVILVDDGKIQWKILEIAENRVTCEVLNSGIVKSNKGVNLPGISVDLDFLVSRDKEMLKEVIPSLKPEIIAPSFVKTNKDIDALKDFVKEICTEAGIENYNPKICPKIETFEAVEKENLEAIVEYSDMIMIARGDLALETIPSHILTPFLQDRISLLCHKHSKPFIVATEMLDSMTTSPVPTRAEVSDIYRAVVNNQAQFVMLSGETASGKNPVKAVSIMNSVINEAVKEGKIA